MHQIHKEKLDDIYQRLAKAGFTEKHSLGLDACDHYTGQPCLRGLENTVNFDLTTQKSPKITAVVLVEGDREVPFYAEIYTRNENTEKNQALDKLVRENVDRYFEGMHYNGGFIVMNRESMKIPKLTGLEGKIPNLPAVLLVKKHITQNRYAIEIYG